MKPLHDHVKSGHPFRGLMFYPDIFSAVPSETLEVAEIRTTGFVKNKAVVGVSNTGRNNWLFTPLFTQNNHINRFGYNKPEMLKDYGITDRCSKTYPIVSNFTSGVATTRGALLVSNTDDSSGGLPTHNAEYIDSVYLQKSRSVDMHGRQELMLDINALTDVFGTNTLNVPMNEKLSTEFVKVFSLYHQPISGVPPIETFRASMTTFWRICDKDFKAHVNFDTEMVLDKNQTSLEILGFLSAINENNNFKNKIFEPELTADICKRKGLISRTIHD